MTPTTQPTRAPRLEPDARAADILTAAVQVARTRGYLRFTRGEVAIAAGVSPALVTHYYPSDELRAAVCRLAIEQEILQIIAEAITGRCPHIESCRPELKQEALLWFAENH